MTDVTSRPAAGPDTDTVDRRRWFGTLFMTDMWERFAFYAVQSLLVLFVAAAPAAGGLGLPSADAAALTGSWIGLTYMLGGPGGWLADRLLGVRATMQLGGAVIAVGHFALAAPVPAVNVVGLLGLSVGAGMYKPNHQALINLMYSTDDRRESGISLLYMGVQISALVAPVMVGLVAQGPGFHVAFAVSGAVMALGVLQFSLSQRRFGSVGRTPTRPMDTRERRRAGRLTLVGLASAAVIAVLAVFGGVGVLLGAYGLGTLLAPLLAYRALYRQPTLGDTDRRRMRSFSWVLAVWLVFFMIISQGGSVVLLFVESHVDRTVFGFTVPTSWFVSVSPIFLLALAPVFSWLLPRIRGGMPVKFTLALLLGGVSFLLLAVAATQAAGGVAVSPVWPILLYLMNSCGELIIIAVALSVASDVLPRAYLSQTIGLLWLFAALGGGLGSQIVLVAQALPTQVYFAGYGLFACLLAGLLLMRRRGIARGLAPRTDAAVDAVGR